MLFSLHKGWLTSWYKKGFCFRLADIDHTASLYNLFIILLHMNLFIYSKQDSPHNTPLELRCLSWPWQNCNHIKSTHVGLQNEILSLFIFHPWKSILTLWPSIMKILLFKWFKSSDAKLQWRLIDWQSVISGLKPIHFLFSDPVSNGTDCDCHSNWFYLLSYFKYKIHRVSVLWSSEYYSLICLCETYVAQIVCKSHSDSNRWDDKIWFRYSSCCISSHKLYFWSLDFLLSAGFSTVWTAMKFCPHIHAILRMNCKIWLFSWK